MEISKFVRLESGYMSIERHYDYERYMLKHELEQYLNEGTTSSMNQEIENNDSNIDDNDYVEKTIETLSKSSRIYSTYRFIHKLKTANVVITSLAQNSVNQMESLAYTRLNDCKSGEIHPYLKNCLGDSFSSGSLEKIIDEEDWFFFKELLNLDISDKYIEFYLKNFYQDKISHRNFDKLTEILQLYFRSSSPLNPSLEKSILDYMLRYYDKSIKPVLIENVTQAQNTSDCSIEVVSNIVIILKVLRKNGINSSIQTSLINHLNFLHNYVVNNMKSESLKYYNSNLFSEALLIIDRIISFYDQISIFGNHDARIKYFKTAHNDLVISQSINFANQKDFSNSNLLIRKVFPMILDAKQKEVIRKLEAVNNAKIKESIQQDKMQFVPQPLKNSINSNYIHQRSSRSGSPLVGLIIIIAIIISISIFSQPDSDEKNSISNPIDENLVERPYPANGEVLSGPLFIDEDSLSYLKVNASSEYSHVIKLYTPYTDDLVIMFFVRAGQTAKVEIPVGVYEIRVADGKKWYGVDNWFGVDTIATRHDEMYTFDQNSEWTITLFRVKDGNLTSTRIDIEDF